MTMKSEDATTVKLRFAVGDRVECRCGDWMLGTVVRHFYTQRSFSEGMCVPYQVKLDSGKLVFAPMDDDRVICAATSSAFDEAAERALSLGLLSEKHLDELTDSIAEGDCDEAEATLELQGRVREMEELQAGGMTSDLPASALARAKGVEHEERRARMDIGRETMAMQMMEATMQAMGVPLPQREWDESELGCTESDYEGLPAQALFLAVKRKQPAELKRLLGTQLSARVNDLDGDGFGLLHTIAYGGHDATMIDTVVEAGGDVDVRNRDFKETPLIIAVMYGHETAVQRLLHHGARADISDWHGTTALTRAQEMQSGRAHADANARAAAPRLIDQISRALEEQKLDIGSGTRFRMNEAETYRQAGNAAFSAGRYQEAIDAYTKSAAAAEDARTYANRAACWLKLGLQRYRELRVSRGLMHQVCDGEAKITRWVPGCDGTFSSPRTPSDSFDVPAPGKAGTYFPFCDGGCSRAQQHAFKCRTVEQCTKSVGDLYREAVSDAGRARTLDPTNHKAYYRQARGNVGLRDFPRARMCLEEGLKACPGNEPMQALLDEIVSLGVGNAISNPLAPGLDEEFSAATAALTSASAVLFCAYCAQPIASKRRTLPKLGKAAFEGKLSKEAALKRAGFPDFCRYCACNPCADIDQRKIRELIEM
jgi:tetratricopeptide (TPR) repeat protein